MKGILFLGLVVLLAGCGGGNDPAALVGQIEAAAKLGPSITPDQLKRAQEASSKLARLGAAAIPAMLEGLGSTERMTRELLVPAFAQIGAPAVASLTAAIADKSPQRRRGAIDALFVLTMHEQVDMTPAVPALKAALTDADAEVRRSALGMLAVVLEEAADPLLIAALKDTDRGVRVSAAQSFALRRSGGQPAPKLPGDLTAMGRIAIRSGANRQVPPEAAPALIAALEDNDQYVQVAAAQALGKLGPMAQSAAPRIAQLLEHHGEHKGKNGFGGHDFANALVGIGPAAIVPLKGLLESKKADVRARAQQALERLEPKK
jgi:HEAT repeat protein